MRKKILKNTEGARESLSLKKSLRRLSEHFNRDDPDILKWLNLKPLLSIFQNK
jgi:hypothetical protein